MSFQEFIGGPWAHSHPAYSLSSFSIRPAPEYATAEILLASTYREAGFPDCPESAVPGFGRELDKASRRTGRRAIAANRVSQETWHTILHGALESPKQPNQSAKRFLQLNPIVPDTALYSGSARLTENSWNPGELISLMVEIGSATRTDAERLWSDFQSALSVTSDDDIWARWLQGEFESRSVAGQIWTPTQLRNSSSWPDDERELVDLPARQFARDLSAVIEAKPRMTRRQWVSLLESILRLGAVAHVLWLCDVNDRLWRQLKLVLAGGHVPGTKTLSRDVVSRNSVYLKYGSPALPIVRDFASRYLVARLGINQVLYHLEALGIDTPTLTSVADVERFLRSVESQREQIREAEFERIFFDLRDKQMRTITCKRGIGSNLAEFCRHAMGQRQSADEIYKGYDQGYDLKKKGSHSSAPWIVSLGPVALLALVHCCLAEAAGPRSVHRLCEHLAWYGVDVNPDDFAKGDLGQSLRMLGLVLDSPDAESGMLLVPPFQLSRSNGVGIAVEAEA